MPPLTIASLHLDSGLFLAPVAGYTSAAFRSVCAGYGAALGFTELVSVEALLRNSCAASGMLHLKSTALLKRGKHETRYAIQLFGAEPERFYEATRLLSQFKPDLLDINAGCPVNKVIKTGAGSALMRDSARLGAIVAAAVQGAGDYLGGIPVSIKMRSGWDAASINFIECAQKAYSAGASMVTLHPRTRTQGYGGKSDWHHIARLASMLPIPVCGSGDLYTAEDARAMLETTGCAAVMFARGAIGNPFIFRQTRALLETGAYTYPSVEEKINTAFAELEMLAEEIGERSACLEMRKVFCAYLKGREGAPVIPNAAALRNKIVHAETTADYRNILSGLIKE
jgi:nifR3 family TIM-barrel protein